MASSLLCSIVNSYPTSAQASNSTDKQNLVVPGTEVETSLRRLREQAEALSPHATSEAMDSALKFYRAVKGNAAMLQKHGNYDHFMMDANRVMMYACRYQGTHSQLLKYATDQIDLLKHPTDNHTKEAKKLLEKSKRRTKQRG